MSDGGKYDGLYDREIWTSAGPGGTFSLYRDNPDGLATPEAIVEEQITATLAEEGFPELYASIGPADHSSFEPSWASVEEEESGEFPGAYSYEQWGTLFSKDDPEFSATFEYLSSPRLVRIPKMDGLEDAVFEADEECLLVVRENF